MESDTRPELPSRGDLDLFRRVMRAMTVAQTQNSNNSHFVSSSGAGPDSQAQLGVGCYRQTDQKQFPEQMEEDDFDTSDSEDEFYEEDYVTSNRSDGVSMRPDTWGQVFEDENESSEGSDDYDEDEEDEDDHYNVDDDLHNFQHNEEDISFETAPDAGIVLDHDTAMIFDHQNVQPQHDMPHDQHTLDPSKLQNNNILNTVDIMSFQLPPEPPPPQPKISPEPEAENTSGPEARSSDSNDDSLRCWEHGCNGRRFTTRSNLRRHLREKSVARPSCQCPHCGAVFSRTTARNTHVARASCNRIRRYSNGRVRPSIVVKDR